MLGTLFGNNVCYKMNECPDLPEKVMIGYKTNSTCILLKWRIMNLIIEWMGRNSQQFSLKKYLFFPFPNVSPVLFHPGLCSREAETA